MQLNKVNRIILAALIMVLSAALISCGAKSPDTAAANIKEPTPASSASAPAEPTPTPAAVTPEPTPTPAAEAASPTPAVGASAETAAESKTDSGTNTPAPAAASAQATNTSTPAPQQSSFKGALSAPIAGQPAFLTSVGQSADVQMVKTLLTRAGIEFEFNSTVKADELSGETLILAVGGSSKGLGAAGIKAEDELIRAAELVKKAESANMTIICVHVGGEVRRGELSDKFINEVVPQSHYIIVVEEGNKDGLFTKIAEGGSIPMDSVKKITAVIDPLKSAFE